MPLAQLIMVRIVTGMFGGTVIASSLAVIADVFPPQRRGEALGKVFGSFSVASIVGVPLTIAAVGWSAGSWWQSRSGWRPVRLLTVGFALVGVGVAALIAVTFGAVSLWVAAPVWTIAGLGMGMGYPTVSVLTLGLSEPEEQGANSAALQVCDVIGGIIGVASAATLVVGFGAGHLDIAMRIADPLLAGATIAGMALSRRAT